ncbi:MAG: PAS domain S-box protein [Deltaproteobacteria bacterium]|nr:PAS domain S-box protein [Deltaproteobacteria bacterium]
MSVTDKEQPGARDSDPVTCGPQPVPRTSDHATLDEALRSSEERNRTILDSNPDPVVVYDREGRVTYFNPAFARTFGWTLGDKLG